VQPQLLPLVQQLRESSLPVGCVADFAQVLKEDGFSMGKFVKDLPPAVAKVKVKLKSPFGKPKDDDKTDVGLTVGCIKSLPESPAEIQGLLKDIALKAGLDFVVEAVESEPREEKVEKKGVRVGVRAGFNMYQYSEHDFYREMGMGGGVGVAVKIPLSSRLSVYSGLDFFYRGLYENYDFNNFYEYYDMYEYALSVPVLIQFALTESFYLATGVYLDFPLAATEVTTPVSEFTETPIGEKQDVTEFRKACDFGLALGFGYMITPSFGIDLRGAMGMTSLFEYEGYKYGSLMQYGLGITYYFF
jgi:hypothetical protein